MQGYIDLCLNVCDGKLWANDINYKKKLDFRFKTDFIFDKKKSEKYLFPLFIFISSISHLDRFPQTHQRRQNAK